MISVSIEASPGELLGFAIGLAGVTFLLFALVVYWIEHRDDP